MEISAHGRLGEKDTMKTNDELVKNFSEKMDAKVDAEESAPKSLKATLFGDQAFEYTAAPSNLPMQVSQRQILAENRDRWGNIGPADSPASAPSLAGTQVVENDNEV
jgi:hypothetical protein